MLKEYLTYLDKNKMYSPNTIRRYETVLSAFVKAMQGKRWSTIEREDIENYLASMNSKENTKSSCLSAIRGIFSYACTHYGLKENPCKFIASPKGRNNIPHVVDIDVIAKAIKIAPKPIKLAILLMSRCGLRVTECLSLNVDTIQSGRILIVGKGKKERYVYLPKYIEELAFDVAEHGRAFTNYTDRSFRYAIWSVFKSLGYEVSPHMLRHTFASCMANNGMPLNHLQVLMGHSDIKTTQVYLHADSCKIKQSYMAAIV